MAYGTALKALGEQHRDLVVIDAGLATAMQTEYFHAAYPDRYLNLGIAEANAVGFASGLARRGFHPIVHSFANFLARRAHDQIAVSVALPCLPVTLVAGSCGVYDGKNGASHFGSDDLSGILTLPGMSVYEPGDTEDLDYVLLDAVTIAGPSYIRLRRYGLPAQLGSGLRGRPTRHVLANSKPQLTVVAVGSILDEALTACLMTQDNGITIDLFHIVRLKPLVSDAIIESARKSKRTIIIENHVVVGGVGQQLAVQLAENGTRCHLFGLPDVFMPAGDPRCLLRFAELDARSLSIRLIRIHNKEDHL